MKERIKTYFKQLFCHHDNLVSDTQIRVMKCEDCGMKRWYSYKDIYSKTR